jgi:hypothetical protein
MHDDSFPWQIMNDYLQEQDIQLIGTRQEPSIAEQQFGNLQVRTPTGGNTR